MWQAEAEKQQAVETAQKLTQVQSPARLVMELAAAKSKVRSLSRRQSADTVQSLQRQLNEAQSELRDERAVEKEIASRGTFADGVAHARDVVWRPQKDAATTRAIHPRHEPPGSALGRPCRVGSRGLSSGVRRAIQSHRAQTPSSTLPHNRRASCRLCPFRLSAWTRRTLASSRTTRSSRCARWRGLSKRSATTRRTCP